MDPSSSSPIAPSPWDAVDRIYCINLRERPDRRRSAEEQFHGLGLLGRVEFITVERHPTDSEQGIFESHQACLRAGLEAGAKVIAVFEDDVVFRRLPARKLQDAARFIRSDQPWSVLFLGCFVFASRRTAFRSVLSIRYQCCAHAYVIHEAFARQLADMSWSGVAYDDLIRDLVGPHAYVLYPALAFQSDATTDNQKMLHADRVRRRLGGYRVLQRWNEFSRHHLWGLVVGHTIFILVVIIIVWLLRRRP